MAKNNSVFPSFEKNLLNRSVICSFKEYILYVTFPSQSQFLCLTHDVMAGKQNMTSCSFGASM